MAYVVSAQKSTAATHCLAGSFLGPKKRNLVIAKSNRLEFYDVGENGLVAVTELTLNGRVEALQSLKLPVQSLNAQAVEAECLFILTDKLRWSIITVDNGAGSSSAKLANGIAFKTLAYGNSGDSEGHENDDRYLCAVDPYCRMVALQIYQGFVRILAIDKRTGTVGETFNVRVEEYMVVDMCFLYTYEPSKGMCAVPTLAVLYDDGRNGRHIKTYEVIVKDRVLHDASFVQQNVDPRAHLMFPVPAPFGGVVVVGEQSVMFHTGIRPTTIGRPGSLMRCFAPVSNSTTAGSFSNKQEAGNARFLMADDRGVLYVLTLRASGASNVTDLVVEKYGETSAAQCLAYLDSGVVFVGSAAGDSQIVKLSHPSISGAAASSATETGPFLTVIDSFANIGPITSMCLVDPEHQGHGHLVTCSGIGKDSSLRIVRAGIGIAEQAMLDVPGLKGVWALAGGRYLVLQFVRQTRVLQINENDTLAECTVAGFDLDVDTRHCGNVGTPLAAASPAQQPPLYGTDREAPFGRSHCVQVTSKQVRLVDTKGFALASSWNAPSTIMHADSYGDLVLVALTGGELFLFQVDAGGSLREIGKTKMTKDIAAVSLHPLTNSTSKFAVLSLWDQSGSGQTTGAAVCILRLPSLSVVLTERLEEGLVSHSVILASLQPDTFDARADYLLASLGDGSVFSYKFDPSTCELSDRRKVSLGSHDVKFVPFYSHGAWHVFACSDRPAVIHMRNHKLSFSHVNSRPVVSVCALPSLDVLAIAEAAGSLILGNMDEIQKLHVKTVPLKEQARAIAYQEASRSLLVATERSYVDDRGAEGVEVHLRMFEESSMELLSVFKLEPREVACSIISCTFSASGGSAAGSNSASSDASAGANAAGEDDDQKTYYVVGTGFMLPSEEVPTRGRILVFYVDSQNALILAAEKEVKGCCYCASSFNGKLLTSVNSKIVLWKWAPKKEIVGSASASALSAVNRELEIECQSQTQVFITLISTRGDFVLVGDMIKSFSLYAYRSVENKFDEVSRHYAAVYTVSGDIVDDETFIVGDHFANLVLSKRNVDVALEEDRKRLNPAGNYHVGELVNCMTKGSLVMQLSSTLPVESKSSAKADDSVTRNVKASILAGSQQGGIFNIFLLSPEWFSFFEKLQNAIRSAATHIGHFDHETFRSIHHHMHKQLPQTGFVDGDLVETLLDLPKEKVSEIVHKCFGSKMTVDEVLKRVEEMEHLH
eukprot:ANDGO_00026.mRNA.1 DNA damage-binding protein 1b